MFRSVIIFALLVFVLLSACSEREPTHIDADTVSEMPNFTSDIVTLPVRDDVVIRYGIKNCDVYQEKTTTDEWELLFKPAPYPLPQQCVRERLDFDGEYIQIEIGTQALGAGGCCTNYAAYRSRDGIDWEIRPATSITEWSPLENKE